MLENLENINIEMDPPPSSTSALNETGVKAPETNGCWKTPLNIGDI